MKKGILRREERKKKVERDDTLSRRDEILQKALGLFLEKGYDATSMSMIADAVGMSKPNLYYYCTSKENLLYEIQMDFSRRKFLPILEIAEKVPDPADRVAYFLREFTLLNTSSPANWILVHEIHRLDEEHRNEILRFWRRSYEIVRDSIRELQQAGRAQKFRESFLSFMWIGTVFWVPYWFDYNCQENAGELAEIISRTFLDSLKSKAAELNREESGAGVCLASQSKKEN